MTKGLPVELKNLHFTTVLDIQRARNDERVARAPSKFAFHHSFGRPTSTKWREGCFGELKNLHFTTVLGVRRARSDERVASASSRICISPQFWASDEHEVTRGLLRQSRKFAFHHSFGRPTITFCVKGCFGNVTHVHFTTVLGVRRAQSDERVVSRRDLPNLPCGKKREEILKRSSILSGAAFSKSSLRRAALLSSLSQQLCSAALLSSFSQQLFSAAFLSSSSQQLFSAALLSSLSQQLFSAAFLSSLSQQLFLAALLSSLNQHLFSAA